MSKPLAPSERNNLQQRLSSRKLVVGQKIERPPQEPKVRSHTAEALLKQTSELAYRLKRALDLCERLSQENHPRVDEAWSKYFLILEEYSFVYESWQIAEKLPMPLLCISCEIEAEVTVDFSKPLPPNARLCANHARDLLAVDAIIRQHKEGLCSLTAKDYQIRPEREDEDVSA